MQEMYLSIVIVTHNSYQAVGKCLDSIGDNPPSHQYEIIVIDNASSDGTCEMISSGYPSVRLIANSDNRGYARGVNQGIRESRGEEVLILNPDIEVKEDSIDRLVEFMDQHPDAGIAASKLIYPDGSLQYSCRTFYNLKIILMRRTFLGKLFPRAAPLREHLMLDYHHKTPRKVDWVLGACMLVRKKVLDRVGLMDERFFLYMEDTDWCSRMKKWGYSVYYVPSSVMIHKYERSSAGMVFKSPSLIHLLSFMRYYEKWNRFFYFLRRHRETLKTAVFIISDLIAINAAFFGAYYLRDFMQPFFVNELYPLSWYYFFILFYNLVFVVTFLFSSLYRIRRETSWMDELIKIIRAVFLVLIILTAATYISRVRIYSRAVLITHAFLAIITVGGLRQFIRKIHRYLVRARFDLKRVVLLGDEEEAETARQRLSEFPSLGLDIVGYVGEGVNALGRMEKLPEIIGQHRVQEVMVLRSKVNHHSLFRVVNTLYDHTVQVRLVSGLARFFASRARVERMAGLSMFLIDRGALAASGWVMKRTIDIMVSILIIPLSALLHVICRMYGWMGGGVRFHSQRCYGNKGDIILWPRMIGRSGGEASDLFKPALLWELIRGRLTLVGPPPLFEDGGRSSLHQAGFLKPGITGCWRLFHYPDRGEAEWDETVNFQNWSLTRDLVIIIRSIVPFIKGSYPEWFFRKGSKV